MNIIIENCLLLFYLFTFERKFYFIFQQRMNKLKKKHFGNKKNYTYHKIINSVL